MAVEYLIKKLIILILNYKNFYKLSIGFMPLPVKTTLMVLNKINKSKSSEKLLI